jgi:hypothetical protein
LAAGSGADAKLVKFQLVEFKLQLVKLQLELQLKFVELVKFKLFALVQLVEFKLQFVQLVVAAATLRGFWHDAGG